MRGYGHGKEESVFSRSAGTSIRTARSCTSGENSCAMSMTVCFQDPLSPVNPERFSDR